MIEQITKDISARLLEERARLCLNQTDMAELGGYSLGAYHSYENAKKLPELRFLFVAAENGLDLNYVLHGVRKTTGAAAEVESLLSNLETLSDKDRTAVLELINALRR